MRWARNGRGIGEIKNINCISWKENSAWETGRRMDGKIKTELKVIICEDMHCAHASGQEQAQ
jgi:hypothetical protein